MARPTTDPSKRRNNPLVLYFSKEEFKAYGGRPKMRENIRAAARELYPEL